MTSRNHSEPDTWDGTRPAWGKGVRELRKFHDISQKELALKAGVTQAHISRLENNIGSHSVAVLIRIAAALNVPAAELFPLSGGTNGEEAS